METNQSRKQLKILTKRGPLGFRHKRMVLNTLPALLSICRSVILKAAPLFLDKPTSKRNHKSRTQKAMHGPYVFAFGPWATKLTRGSVWSAIDSLILYCVHKYFEFNVHSRCSLMDFNLWFHLSLFHVILNPEDVDQR